MRLGLLAVLLLTACRVELGPPSGHAAVCADGTGAPTGELWVYTSMYRHVIDRLEPALREKWPALKISWFQSGSEKVAARMEAELAAGGTRADAVMTSDPFWYERLKGEGRLLRYVPPDALRMPLELADADGHFATARVSTMVIAYDRRRVSEADAPRKWSDLTLPRWRGKVAMPDPLQSGTAFTTVAFLSRALGWDFFAALGRNGAVASGGNSVVLGKLEAGEAHVGVVLLENVLASKTGSLAANYPEDGPVIIPGYAAILSTTRNPIAARAFVDFVLSPVGQRAVAEDGAMHSADARVAAPRGARAWPDLYAASMRWSEELRAEVAAHSTAIKERFGKEFYR